MLSPAGEVINTEMTKAMCLISDEELPIDPQDRQYHMAGAFVLSMNLSDIACKPIVNPF